MEERAYEDTKNGTSWSNKNLPRLRPSRTNTWHFQHTPWKGGKWPQESCHRHVLQRQGWTVKTGTLLETFSRNPVLNLMLAKSTFWLKRKEVTAEFVEVAYHLDCALGCERHCLPVIVLLCGPLLQGGLTYSVAPCDPVVIVSFELQITSSSYHHRVCFSFQHRTECGVLFERWQQVLSFANYFCPVRPAHPINKVSTRK